MQLTTDDVAGLRLAGMGQLDPASAVVGGVAAVAGGALDYVKQKHAYKVEKRMMRAEGAALEQEEAIAAKAHARRVQSELIALETFKRKLRTFASVAIPFGLVLGGLIVLRGGRS